MKELTIDERIALLIDGKLDAAERQALLAELKDSDEDFLVFADAASVTRQREDAAAPADAGPAASAQDETDDVPAAQTDPPPRPYLVAAGAEEDGSGEEGAEPRLTVVPPEPDRTREEAAGDARVVPLRPRRRFPLAAWGAIAAVLVGVALIPVLRARGGNPADPARLASALSPAAARLPAKWIDERPWRVPRGGGDEGDHLTDQARSARLGALLVDLELAAHARDTATVGLLAERVSAHLGNVPGAGELAVVYDSIALMAPKSADVVARLREEGLESMPDAADMAYVHAGAWSEAALLAANAHDATFFRTRASRDMPARIAALPGLDGEGRAAAGQVRAALARDGTPDWAALQQSLSDLLGALGG